MVRASRFEVTCDHLLSWRCVKAVHQKVKVWGQCDISSVLGILDIHMGLWWGWNNVGKKNGLKKSSPAIALKQGRGLKGSTVVWGPVQNSGKEGSVRFERLEDFALPKPGIHPNPNHHSGASVWMARMTGRVSLNYHLGTFFKLGTLSLFNFRRLLWEHCYSFTFVVGELKDMTWPMPYC